jgi:hypothetical protein
VSISDMQSFAEKSVDPFLDTKLSSDIGNIISLGGDEFGNDIRLSFMANTTMPQAHTHASMASNTTAGGQSVTVQPLTEVNDISIAPLEPLDNISIPLGPEPIPLAPMPEIRINREGSSNMNSSNSGAGGIAPNLDAYNSHFQPIRTQEDIEKEKKEKAELLTKLTRLESRGYTLTHRFTMDNNLDEIRQEFERLSDQRNLEASIKFQRQMMMGFVTGAELLNNKFDPFGWQLDGWSESVHENVEDFDEVFEELYDKYKGKGAMPPEARLLFMLAGSGFMFHMSNQFFRSKTQGMGMEDILRQNPELAKQFAAAAANAAGPGFGNFMGMSMGVPPQASSQPSMQVPGTGAFYQAVGTPAPSPLTPSQGMGGIGGGRDDTRGQLPTPQIPQNVAAAAATITPRREMRGPAGVDDILRTFEEARRQEAESAVQGASGVGFGGPAAVSSIGQPAVQVLNEVQSIASEEVMSQAESTRTGGRGGTGGRRRKVVPPPQQMNTISMNV